MLHSRDIAVFIFQSAQQISLLSSSGPSSHLLQWLMHLGVLGLFAVAVVDSSVIPVPLPGSTDLVLLLLVAYGASSVSVLASFVASAIAGSVVGGYLTWAAGVKGGNAAMERLGKGRFVGKVSGWVKKNGLLSIAVAALLPPPIPLLPFLIAAGAFGLRRGRFLVSYCAARIVRYSVIAWLAYSYGRNFLVLWQKELKGWSTLIISVYIGLIVLGAFYAIWKYLKTRRSEGAGSQRDGQRVAAST
jgi:membrane protein YqaA with SNARE-associated domain